MASVNKVKRLETQEDPEKGHAFLSLPSTGYIDRLFDTLNRNMPVLCILLALALTVVLGIIASKLK